jgi:diaminopimelate decarboxylase
MSLDKLPQHAPHPFFDVKDNCLTVAGRPLTEIAAQVGSTPFYAYSRQYAADRVALLRRSLPKQVELHYAIKANPSPEVVRHMAGLVDGLDVASVGELEIALAAGMKPDCISFAGPGKKPAELERAVLAGVVLNVESELEAARLAEIGRKTGRKPLVAVRVNPDFELKSSGMKMSGGPKQFGVDAERVPELLGTLAPLGLEFMGFHIFSGSQNLRPESIVDAQQKAVALAVELARHAPSPVRILNIGGGFGIPYFPGEKPLDIAPIGANLEQLVPQVQAQLPQAQLVIELGRYLIGESGIYVCRVVDRKVSRGHVFLITDGGLHHHLAASGNFGQVLRKNYPVVIGNRMHSDRTETVSVVGPLCTPLDLLADRVTLPVAEVDDLIVVLQSGAYGYTASPLGFLGHPAPKEILL